LLSEERDFTSSYSWKLRDVESATASEGSVSEVLSPSVPEDWLRSMREIFKLPDFVLKLCFLRGIREEETLSDFLKPALERLGDPMAMIDMDKAVDCVGHALERNELIWVLGDYDVDGTSGASLLTWVLRDLQANFKVFQPDRFLDGYGLNLPFIERAIQAKAKVLITVDCGITSIVPIDRAEAAGLSVVVLDHHAVDPAQGIPKGTAIVDAHRPDCQSGYKELCGCGVAFFFARALRKWLGERDYFRDRKAPNLKQHLDLVSLATAADIVPLIGQNHILVRHGMELLTHSKKPGFMKLLEVSGLMQRTSMSPSSLGFALAPRINASGRMEHASIALELLTTEDAGRANELGGKVEALNLERQEVQNRIWDEVRQKAQEGIARGAFPHAIVLASENWHEGVVGIVASRVVEAFHKPAVVISVRDGHAKGSVRSALGKDVLEGLRSCRDLLAGFGGHKHAAGLSLKPEQIDAFCQSYNAAMSNLPAELKEPTLKYDAWSSLSELSLEAVSQLEKLGPFGPGNPEPVFLLEARAVTFKSLKFRHLKLELAAGDSSHALSAIWFGVLEKKHFSEAVLRRNSLWAITPEVNRFRGQHSIQLRVKDWKPLSEHSGLV